MSRYAINKALWQVARDENFAAAYLASPEQFLSGRDLTDEEKRQLVERDYRGMFSAGAHPFLLYTFRIKVSGGWTWRLMEDHVVSLVGIKPPLDIST